jgi:hypothetical protein
MSLLWNTAVQHQAMPWHTNPHEHPVVHPVKKAGFASYTDDQDYMDELKESMGNEGQSGFDEDLYDETAPDPTSGEQAHYDEHGEYPESHFERHDQAYEKAKREKAAQEEPDRDDPDLMKFVRDFGSDTDLWQKHGEYKPVNLRQRVHATQPLVSESHIRRYLNNPQDATDHAKKYGPGDYLGNTAPMFVTHQGELHATEGHHRTAAALRRGDHSIMGWHYDLDKDPAGVRGRDEEDDY